MRVCECEWVFAILYGALLIPQLFRRSLKRVDKYHVTVKLFVWSIWMMMAAMTFRLYHYVLYSGDGIGNKTLFFAASILASASEILLVVHFILIAKGWTIVRRKISASGR